MGSKSYSKGISWFDDCRIPFVDEKDIKSQERAFSPNSSSHKGDKWNNKMGWKGSTGPAERTDTRGRFPANILVCDDMLNDGKIGKSAPRKPTGNILFSEDKGWNQNNMISNTWSHLNDKGTNSRYYDIDKWFDNILNG